MAIGEIRIDEETWSKATALRRAEWRTLISDLLEEGPLAESSAADRMIVSALGKTIRLEIGEDSVELDDALVGPHMAEYLAIIRQMIDHVEPHRWEALDMAKKVVHDRGAKALASRAGWLSKDHESFRRLFSLLVALVEDTTMLPVAHRHRL